MARCWEVIDAQAQLALNSEGFTEIDIDTLKQILQRESLNCKEVQYFLKILIVLVGFHIIFSVVRHLSSCAAMGSCRM
jgi:hypothetical protein